MSSSFSLTLLNSKGAVIIRFVLDDSSFCFLNCHLAAGEEHTEARRQDVNTILSSPLPLAKSTTQRAFVARGDGTEVADTELTFFFGKSLVPQVQSEAEG